ncbi:diacylglycerol kinase family protein [Spirosoma sp. 209]|uniref:diacylglycerol/lipid kinase family protein n=1 Tax=Spirosoma sp. 209 TaxID=1955701 RepID=UPI00098D2721|nr:diacylglycerol kinase family protein [Spirosoma sp. 209]
MTFLFAINPVSGGRDKSDWEEGIRQFFADLPHTVHVLELNGKTDDELVRQQIALHQPDRVVAVGGDGTIKCVGTQLLGTDTVLGILPAGSANGLARELGIPPDIEASLSVLVNGTPKPVDVISINEGDICLHLGDIGLNARVVKHYQDNNWRGMFGYLRAVIKALQTRQLLRVEINLGETCVSRAALMVVLANARMYGTGAVINPDGDMSDGQFEVVIFRRLAIWEILKLFWRYRPFDPRSIEIYPATSISVETRRKAYFQIDGEYRGRINQLKAAIRPGALTVLVPSETAP